MITIFSTPKNFEGIYKIIQMNALQSWRKISPDIQIIILGDSKGSQAAANEISADYIPKVLSSKQGTPILSDLFRQSENIAKFSIMTFINSDIILPESFLKNVKIVEKYFSKFLLIGHRWDINIESIINFNDENKIKMFWKDILLKSQKHDCSGIDYFVFRKGQMKNIPDFVIGRWGYDNWIVWNARRSLIPVIDGSEEICAVHQNHDYTFHKIRDREHSKNNSEALKNKKIYQNKTMNILDSTYELKSSKVERKNNKSDKIRYWKRMRLVFPELSLLFKVIYKIRAKWVSIEI